MPKQFIALIGPRSTFQDTISASAGLMFERADRDHQPRLPLSRKEQLAEIGVAATIVTEPVAAQFGPGGRRRRGARRAQRSRDRRRRIRVRPRDHQAGRIPRDCAGGGGGGAARLYRHARRQADRAGDRLRLYPAGRADRRGRGARKVDAFVEKPEREIAERYVEAGYLWNSGNFFFRADVMREELQSFEPEMVEAVDAAIEQARRRSRLPRARRRRLRRRAEEVDRLRRHGAHAARRRGARRHRLVRRRQLGCGLEASASATSAAIRSTARASRWTPTTSISARPGC